MCTLGVTVLDIQYKAGCFERSDCRVCHMEKLRCRPFVFVPRVCLTCVLVRNVYQTDDIVSVTVALRRARDHLDD